MPKPVKSIRHTAEKRGERSFFSGDHARYGWAKLMRSRLGGGVNISAFYFQLSAFILPVPPAF